MTFKTLYKDSTSREEDSLLYIVVFVLIKNETKSVLKKKEEDMPLLECVFLNSSLWVNDDWPSE